MTYEVSAAAKPPQTIPLYMGIRVDPREGNGEYRRRRAVGPRPHFLSHLSMSTVGTKKSEVSERKTKHFTSLHFSK